MDELRSLYDKLHRDPEHFPLFARIWEVLSFAPSSRHYDKEAMVSQAADALDYLLAEGRWQTVNPMGVTELTWNGQVLGVREEDHRDEEYARQFPVAQRPIDRTAGFGADALQE